MSALPDSSWLECLRELAFPPFPFSAPLGCHFMWTPVAGVKVSTNCLIILKEALIAHITSSFPLNLRFLLCRVTTSSAFSSPSPLFPCQWRNNKHPLGELGNLTSAINVKQYAIKYCFKFTSWASRCLVFSKPPFYFLEPIEIIENGRKKYFRHSVFLTSH